MPATKPKSRKRKRHHSTSQSSSSSSSSDCVRLSPEKRRPKKQKRSSTNYFEANSDAEAQLLIQQIQQRQTLNLTKQINPLKDTEGLEDPNHSTWDQSPTGDLLSQIDWEEDVDCQTGPKISESLAKRVEFKWQTKLTLDQLKEKSKNLLIPENYPKVSVPLTNKEVFSQLNNTQGKADLRLRNLQKNFKKQL